tara:strand:+ start:385 stop:699 length:315 start_codon:yes stop_codon:yes gene_type:complete
LSSLTASAIADGKTITTKQTDTDKKDTSYAIEPTGIAGTRSCVVVLRISRTVSAKTTLESVSRINGRFYSAVKLDPADDSDRRKNVEAFTADLINPFDLSDNSS